MIKPSQVTPNYRWWAFGSIGLGTFLSVVDHGSVLVALPNIERHFDSNLASVQWVMVGYALAISVLLLPMGRLGDIIGRKKVYLWGFFVFVISAALAGSAPSLTTLIGAKILQGVGSAMIQGNGMAILVSAFPEKERGKALGAHLSIVGVGGIAGPAVGGFLMTALPALDWRVVMLVNVPVGITCIIATVFILNPDDPSWKESNKAANTFDWVGAILSGSSLLVFLLTISNGHAMGWLSVSILCGMGLSLILLASFIRWELHSTSPLLDLRLFQRKLVALGSLAGWISFLGSSSTRFMMPFYLQRVLGYSPREVGLFLIPPALCMVILGPISGRLSDRFGWQIFTITGLALSTAASFIFAITLHEQSKLSIVILLLMIQSAGGGMFNSPNNSSILSAVERHMYGVTSALTQLIRNSANVVSVALTTTVVVVTMGTLGVEASLDAVSPGIAGAFIEGLHRNFFLMSGILGFGLLICLLRGGQTNTTPIQKTSDDIHLTT